MAGGWWKCDAVPKRQQTLASGYLHALRRLKFLGVVESASFGAFTTVGCDPGCIRKEGHGPLALACLKVRHNAVFGQRI